MNQKERMLSELPYLAFKDGLSEERLECKKRIYELNNIHPDQYDRIPNMLKNLFGKTGDSVYIEPPFHCDYGYNIEVGDQNNKEKKIAVNDRILFRNNFISDTSQSFLLSA